MALKRIHVAVGTLQDRQGRILVAKRPEHSHQGGLWEFPGGKLESGEGLAEGLSRELREELGIRVVFSEPLIRIHHDYADRHVLLDVHRIPDYVGEPHGREDQPLRWVHPGDMVPDDFPAADRPIINALRLPDRMLITGADPNRKDEFLERLKRALEAGIRLVQLRAAELPLDVYTDLAESVARCCVEHEAGLLLNGPDGAWESSGIMGGLLPGLHLPARHLAAVVRRPAGPNVLIGASCHNQGELARAADLGLDYALLSPVKPTASHPGVKELGWEHFSALVDKAALPVFALGGVGLEDIPLAKRHGGQGIAAIGALWGS